MSGKRFKPESLKEFMGEPNGQGQAGQPQSPRTLRKLNSRHMARTEPPPIEWEVDGIAARGEVTMLYGPGGIGKSLFCLHLSQGVALGESVASIDCAKGRVLYLDAENGQYEIHRRFHALGLPEEGVAFYVPEAGFHLEDCEEELAEAVADEEATLLVLDSLRPLLPNGKENDSEEMTAAIHVTKRIAQQNNCAVVVIHHARKNDQTYRGSSALRDQVSILYSFGREPADAQSGRRYLENEKMRVAPEQGRRWIDLHDGLSLSAGEAPEPGELLDQGPRHTQDVLAVLREKGPLRQSHIAEALGRSKGDGAVRRALKELDASGHVTRRADKRWEVAGGKSAASGAAAEDESGPAKRTPKRKASKERT